MKLHGRNISTNSVSFISPICGGGSKTLYIGAETSYSRRRDITLYQQVRCGDTTLMSDWWTFVRNDVKLTQGQVYQVKAMTAYHMKTRSAHKVSVQAVLQLNNVEQRHWVKRSLKHEAISLRWSIKHANDDVYNPQLLLTLLVYSIGRWTNFVYSQWWWAFPVTITILTDKLTDFMVNSDDLTDFTANSGNFTQFTDIRLEAYLQRMVAILQESYQWWRKAYPILQRTQIKTNPI